VTWDGTRPHPDAGVEQWIRKHERRRAAHPPRFKVGDEVLVRDKGAGRGGYRIVKATVVEVHDHPGREPGYPHGEGYELDGELWWSCYPGCRVWATRAEALAARMDMEWIREYFYGPRKRSVA
jgi:hypothetical protein